tara:strand:- start:77 stop:847 length:771 start_codon:yes stop_codon:yes gene_type:complete
MASPQPIDLNTPMSTLLDEKFTEVHNFQSPLAQVDLLSASFLATVTDEDIEAYDKEITDFDTTVTQIKRRNLNVMTSHISKMVGNIYGNQSKQYKYLMRNFQSNDEVPCFQASLALKSTESIRDMVNDARKANKSTSHVVLADRDVTQIDCAIQYLVQNGYEYGKDFNASNVVNLAKSVALQDLTDKEFDGFLNDRSNCSEICITEPHEVVVSNGMVNIECACGGAQRSTIISIVENPLNSGEFTYELEDIANVEN